MNESEHFADTNIQILHGLGFNFEQIAFYDRIRRLPKIHDLRVLVGCYHSNIPQTSFPGIGDHEGDRLSDLVVEGLVPESLYSRRALQNYLYENRLVPSYLGVANSISQPRRRICLVAGYEAGPTHSLVFGNPAFVKHLFHLVARKNKEGPLRFPVN